MNDAPRVKHGEDVGVAFAATYALVLFALAFFVRWQGEDAPLGAIIYGGSAWVLVWRAGVFVTRGRMRPAAVLATSAVVAMVGCNVAL